VRSSFFRERRSNPRNLRSSAWFFFFNLKNPSLPLKMECTSVSCPFLFRTRILLNPGHPPVLFRYFFFSLDGKRTCPHETLLLTQMPTSLRSTLKTPPSAFPPFSSRTGVESFSRLLLTELDVKSLPLRLYFYISTIDSWSFLSVLKLRCLGQISALLSLRKLVSVLFPDILSPSFEGPSSVPTTVHPERPFLRHVSIMPLITLFARETLHSSRAFEYVASKPRRRRFSPETLLLIQVRHGLPLMTSFSPINNLDFLSC